MLCVVTLIWRYTHPCSINMEICCGKPLLSAPSLLKTTGKTHMTPEKRDYNTNHVLKPITPNREFTELNSRNEGSLTVELIQSVSLLFQPPDPYFLVTGRMSSFPSTTLEILLNNWKCFGFPNTFQLSFPLAFLFSLEHLEGNFSWLPLAYQVMTHSALGKQMQATVRVTVFVLLNYKITLFVICLNYAFRQRKVTAFFFFKIRFFVKFILKTRTNNCIILVKIFFLLFL